MRANRAPQLLVSAPRETCQLPAAGRHRRSRVEGLLNQHRCRTPPRSRRSLRDPSGIGSGRERVPPSSARMSVEDAARVTTARAKKRFPTRPRARKLYTADPTVTILLCQRGNPAPVQALCLSSIPPWRERRRRPDKCVRTMTNTSVTTDAAGPQKLAIGIPSRHIGQVSAG